MALDDKKAKGRAGRVSGVATRKALAGYAGAHQLHPAHLRIYESFRAMYPTAERALFDRHC